MSESIVKGWGVRYLFFSFFLAFNLFASFKIAIPKDVTAPTYKKTFDLLHSSGIMKQYDIKIKEIDFSSDIETVNKELRDCNLVFVTGGYFDMYNKKIKGKIPVVFLGIKKQHSLTNELKPYATGVYRDTTVKQTILQASKILNSAKKIGFLYKANSELSLLAPNFVKSLKGNDIDLKLLPYNSSSDFETIFKKSINDKLSGILLFPPSVNNIDFKTLLALQTKYKLPIVSQLKSQIDQGAMAGPVIDYETIIPQLVKRITAIVKGTNPTDLPIYTCDAQIYINLSTVSQLEYNVADSIIKQSKITGLLNTKLYKDIVLKKGSYSIAISYFTQKDLFDILKEKLEVFGYKDGENLKINRFYCDKMSETLNNSDLIFMLGSCLKSIPDTIVKPMVFLSSSTRVDKNNKFTTGVYRQSVEEILADVKQFLDNKNRVGILYNSGTNLKSVIDGFDTTFKSFNLNIVKKEYLTQEQLEDIVKEFKKSVDVVLLFPPAIPKKDLPFLIELQNRYKLPIISQRKEEVEAGILFGIAIDFQDALQINAKQIDKILQGVDASDIPTEFVKSTFYLNLRTSEIISADIPTEIMSKTKVIIK